jgi:hypothetical protein
VNRGDVHPTNRRSLLLYLLYNAIGYALVLNCLCLRLARVLITQFILVTDIFDFRTQFTFVIALTVAVLATSHPPVLFLLRG